MIISKLTKPRLDYLRENCNFIREEITIFELRSKGYTLEQIADETGMTIDSVQQFRRKVNHKINDVL